ncbi:hypothetical protein [Mucisphaera sp.]|uniref:hypothetical protein n=1 Tax=Mucisphaera sp. TaxID=2913024 RepID=UPI003D1126F8
MLSLPQIQRSVLSGDTDQILMDLARHGTLLPLPIRLELSQSSRGCLGLALRRVAELTHGPTGLSRGILERLLLAESGDEGNAAALAATLAGLCRAMAYGTVDEDLETDVREQVEAGWLMLAGLQEADGLLGGEGADEMDRVRLSAFVVYLLGPMREDVRYLDVSSLLTALEDRRPLDDARAEELVDVALATWPRGVGAGDRRIGSAMLAA